MSNIEQGKIYWVDAEPHSGREQGGHNPMSGNVRRPVVVVSNDGYGKTGMAIVFPITLNQTKSRYLMPINLKKPSQVILSQILGYDMVARRAEEYSQITSQQLQYLKRIVRSML
ncbi:MAG: type II toxin-antitoxin system PemK/MazF family toxin [Lactobacillaceae bacterium]|jgi:mRNA interferase MazF|nr:type II toxin-antitoxin system PemK/MazF family toxin [Lactobacillaceae bacterium]